jgi:hypothetical protein
VRGDGSRYGKAAPFLNYPLDIPAPGFNRPGGSAVLFVFRL